METHKVEDVNRGLYTVDGSLHNRKDLQGWLALGDGN